MKVFNNIRAFVRSLSRTLETMFFRCLVLFSIAFLMDYVGADMFLFHFAGEVIHPLKVLFPFSSAAWTDWQIVIPAMDVYLSNVVVASCGFYFVCGVARVLFDVLRALWQLLKKAWKSTVEVAQETYTELRPYLNKFVNWTRVQFSKVKTWMNSNLQVRK